MTRWALRWLAMLAAVLPVVMISACTTRPVVPDTRATLFNDAAFQPAGVRIAAADVFAMTPEMRDYFEREVAPSQMKRGMQRGLIDALYAREQLKLRYDNEYTRSAAEAFEARAGNCLSLVVMTAAFAKHAGMPVRYQSVHVDPTYGRRGNLFFSIGHVNVSLGRYLSVNTADARSRDWLTIDFLPQADAGRQRFEAVEESTLIGMFMNNKAAEALGAGRLDDAYWWARAAIEQDRQLLIAYNTLAVIYRRHGELDDAERVLRFALTLEPDNTNVLGNLAHLVADRGRTEEAQQLQARLARLQPDPPFKFFDLGMEAMRRGEWTSARDHFQREINRDPDYHEFHFWIAQAYLRIGDASRARKHLAAALENSGTVEQQATYSAKLQKLKAQRLLN
jgi:Tfp pilus assembly protein PilF